MKRAPLSRRQILKSLSSVGLLPLLSGNLIACSGTDDKEGASYELSPRFRHGVASGDPGPDRVILWTRVEPESDAMADSVSVRFEVSTDDDFSSLSASGEGSTSVQVDHTLKVDVQGLEPGTTYYYRFIVDDGASVVGKTKTLPAGAIDDVRFAVVSCSNYPAGYFHVYREIAHAELDAVLHLGDYLYEYGVAGYASERAAEMGRVVEPTTELLSLGDYRTRYALYRRDVDLQDCHAAHPFIAVWDDHEVTNDAYTDGAENHDEGEGDFDERKAQALQAYFEWMPIRPPVDGSEEIIYRRFRYGDLVDLLMLDTRLIGRNQQLSLLSFVTPDGTGLDLAAARSAIDDPERTLLGSEQKQWLLEQLAESDTRWQVLGQQVLMGRYELPAALLLALNPDSTDADAVRAGTETALDAVTAKNKAPNERTEEEQLLLASSLPYNLDAWDGYASERDEVLQAALDGGKKLIVLSGDTHNAWASQLTTRDGAVAGAELAAPSVSSPGLEGVLGAGAAGLFQGIVTTLVDDLRYADLSQRGFLRVTFGKEGVEASFEYVSTVQELEYERESATLASVDPELALTVT